MLPRMQAPRPDVRLQAARVVEQHGTPKTTEGDDKDDDQADKADGEGRTSVTSWVECVESIIIRVIVN